MKIPIINGIYNDTDPDFRVQYPINILPIPMQTGINEGYLRTAPGITRFAKTSAIDRGGIVWNGAMYRVIGGALVQFNNIDNQKIEGIGITEKEGTQTHIVNLYTFLSEEIPLEEPGTMYYYLYLGDEQLMLETEELVL